MGLIMIPIDNLRALSHALLLELDDATTQMMMLVSSKQVGSAIWIKAADRHRAAYAAWNSFVNLPIVKVEPSVDQEVDS